MQTHAQTETSPAYPIARKKHVCCDTNTRTVCSAKCDKTHNFDRTLLQFCLLWPPSVCLLGLFFTLWWLDCVFDFIWPLLHQRLALPACQKLLSNVWLFRLWDIITLFCLSAVGLNCNSTLIESSRTSRFLAAFFNTDFVIETSRRSYHHHRYIQTLKLKVLAPERNPNLVKI